MWAGQVEKLVSTSEVVLQKFRQFVSTSKLSFVNAFFIRVFVYDHPRFFFFILATTV